MSTYGIGESAESQNTYAVRDYSRCASKSETPVRYITRVGAPDNVTAWLVTNMNRGAMIHTINGKTYYEIGHALAVWDKTTGTTSYPLMPRRGNRRRGANGVSVERALSIYDND